jgi:hypothetical protein
MHTKAREERKGEREGKEQRRNELLTYVESAQLPHWCRQVEVLDEGGTLEHVRAVHLQYNKCAIGE